MPEKPCEWAENPSGAVWECNAHSTQCAHKHADTNPDGSVNIFECQLGDQAYAFREIKRLQRLTQSYQETVDRLVGILQERWKTISECWIPVTDRLPDYGEEVLATTAWNDIVQMQRLSGNRPNEWEWASAIGSYYYEPEDVIAWMPLPEPYKEEE